MVKPAIAVFILISLFFPVSGQTYNSVKAVVDHITFKNINGNIVKKDSGREVPGTDADTVPDCGWECSLFKGHPSALMPPISVCIGGRCSSSVYYTNCFVGFDLNLDDTTLSFHGTDTFCGKYITESHISNDTLAYTITNEFQSREFTTYFAFMNDTIIDCYFSYSFYRNDSTIASDHQPATFWEIDSIKNLTTIGDNDSIKYMIATYYLAANEAGIKYDVSRHVDEKLIIVPNPFSTVVFFEIRNAKSELRNTKLEIFDLAGRRVWSHAARRSSHVWDGRDDLGRLVPDGVYVVRLRTGGW
jgi:hypothetical protein